MALSEPTQEPDETKPSSADNDGPDGTAPDSETQSGAASEAGGRTSEEGSHAPNDPAEGA